MNAEWFGVILCYIMINCFIFFTFTLGVKSNFHAIFIMDSSQSSIETVVETHPGMYKYSETVRMNSWSEESMLAVANKIINR